MLKINNIIAPVIKIASKAYGKITRYSPQILMGGGIVGVVTSTVLACKATLDANEIKEKFEKDMNDVHEARRLTDEADKHDDYPDATMRRDIAIVYTQTAVRYAKKYALSASIMATSIACILGSHKILTGRNAAITAAYMTLNTAFKDYRERAIERFGKDVDRELRYGIDTKDRLTSSVNKDGKETVETTEMQTIDEPACSEYTLIFDESNEYWSKDADKNKFFLLQQQNWANEKLKSQGYLFLNDVRKMLGYKATKVGQVVGWIYKPEDKTRDSFVDFGIFRDLDKSIAKRMFINGDERSIMLDFNVDGPIIDLL